MTFIKTGLLTPIGFQFLEIPARSLAEAAPHEPEGIYTVTRTYQRLKALLLDEHFDRLEESANLEDIPLKLDRKAVRTALRRMIIASGYPESRFRITIPRGDPRQIYIAMERLKPVPEAIRMHGAKVATIENRRPNPAAKTTAWMEQRQEAAAALPPDTYETLLIGVNGELLEGSGSNFYAVSDGILRTAEEGILNGISRRVLLACIENTIRIDFTPVTLSDIPMLDEAFLTSSTRCVVPIVQIDGQSIGDGRPGPITRDLSQRYEAWEESHLEPI